MLPEPNRLRRHSDFALTVKRGRRSGRRDVVVHAFDHASTGELVRCGGPRFGLVVSKAVGPAVIRHRVARRLRHICVDLMDRVPDGTDVVIRALPGAAAADSRVLDEQVRSLLRRMNLLEPVNESVSESV